MKPKADQAFLNPTHQCLSLYALAFGNLNRNDEGFEGGCRQSYCQSRSRWKQTLSALVTYL
jgi:hypothetical protein